MLINFSKRGTTNTKFTLLIIVFNDKLFNAYELNYKNRIVQF